MKKVVSETFVSFDGHKFDDEECCEKYEGRVVNGAWRVFPKARVDATRFGIGKKEDECYVFIPKTQEDLNMLNAYIRRELFYATDFFFAEDIGKAMLVDFGNDSDDCHVYDLADYTPTSEYVRLPYSIGETVYYISGLREYPVVRSATVSSVTICDSPDGFAFELLVVNEDGENFMSSYDVFYPSREEAEKAIKEKG